MCPSVPHSPTRSTSAKRGGRASPPSPGVDEVGRGCLFGPVVAAAVVLDPARPLRGLNDSKLLDAEEREVLAARIRERALAVSVGAVDAATIDLINILQASRLAMKLAVEGLSKRPDYLLVDYLALDLPIAQIGLVKGDQKSRSIAAASIIAKVERDRWMQAWDALYPAYGLASNKGYSAPKHLAALAKVWLHAASQNELFAGDESRPVHTAWSSTPAKLIRVSIKPHVAAGHADCSEPQDGDAQSDRVPVVLSRSRVWYSCYCLGPCCGITITSSACSRSTVRCC